MLKRRSRRTLGSMLAAFHICSQLNAGEGAHNSLRFSSGTSPSQSSTTFLYGPAGSVHSAPTSILICVFRLLMVCTPSQTRGSATTQTANSHHSRHQTRVYPTGVHAKVKVKLSNNTDERLKPATAGIRQARVNVTGNSLSGIAGSKTGQQHVKCCNVN